MARLFPLPFLLAGMANLAFGVRNVYSARVSSSWPRTTGTIVSSEVERSTSRSSGGKHGSRTSTAYHARVTYSYAVDGVSWEGRNVAFGDYGSGNPSHAAGVVARYPVNRRVDVFYAPDSPGRAVLAPGLRAQVFFLPAFGAVFAAAGAVMLVFLPRLAREGNPAADRASASRRSAAAGLPEA